MSCVVRTRVWRDGALVDKDLPLAEVSSRLGDDSCLTWIDMVDPDQASLDELAGDIGLDPHAVEDALTVAERPKASRYPSHLFLTVFTVTGLADNDDVHRLSVFVLPRGVVTIRLGDSLDMDEVARRWDDVAPALRGRPALLVHSLLDVVVDGYFEAVERLDDRIDDLESGLFERSQHTGNAIATEAFGLHKDLSRLRRVVLPMREVATTVLRTMTEQDRNQEVLPYFQDLYDHTLRAAEWTDSLRDMITSIRDTNMALVDTQLNQVMKKLTAWAAIVAVPTAITGWFGQNVPYPGFSKDLGLYLSAGSIIVIAVALYISFKIRDWL